MTCPPDYLEEDDHDYIEFGDDDNHRPCECDPYGADECPLCCGNSGWYQPGTEECDWCAWGKFCRERQREVV